MNAPLRDFRLWLRELDVIAEQIEIDAHRAEVRRQIRQHESSRRPPVAFRPLPYSDPLGPTGTSPRSFLHVGGGNKTGNAKTDPKPPTGFNWEDLHGLTIMGSDRPLHEMDRALNNIQRQWSRIRANGGKRKPAHRPRTIPSDKEQRVRDLLKAGCGVKKTAGIVGVGISAVQRIKREGVP